MKIIYCNRWSTHKKRIVKELSVAEALACHQNRKWYELIVEIEQYPFCYIQLNNDFVLVGFLDDLNRDYLTYEFAEIQAGKLFLKEAQFWEFEGETDQKIFSTRYFFSPDGQLKIEKANIKTHEVETLIAKNSVDVSANYEKYPEFGHYENLIKVERLEL